MTHNLTKVLTKNRYCHLAVGTIGKSRGECHVGGQFSPTAISSQVSRPQIPRRVSRPQI